MAISTYHSQVGYVKKIEQIKNSVKRLQQFRENAKVILSKAEEKIDSINEDLDKTLKLQMNPSNFDSISGTNEKNGPNLAEQTVLSSSISVESLVNVLALSDQNVYLY